VKVLREWTANYGYSQEYLAHLLALPHGIDTRIFYPLKKHTDSTPDLAASPQLARQLLWPDNSEMAEAFLVLNSNQHSKRIDLTLKGFEKFAHNKPENVKLILNMARYFGPL